MSFDETFHLTAVVYLFFFGERVGHTLPYTRNLAWTVTKDYQLVSHTELSIRTATIKPCANRRCAAGGMSLSVDHSKKPLPERVRKPRKTTKKKKKQVRTKPNFLLYPLPG